jgi:hypothetical protein
MNTYKIICFYKDAPDLCGEVYRNAHDQDSNLYSYEQAITMVHLLESDNVYSGQGFRLEEAA